MRLTASLWVTPKRCSSSTTRRPELLEGDVLAQQPVGADDHVDAPVGQAGTTLRLLAGERNRLSSSTRTGYGANRSAKVWACWLASSVVGTSTAAWYPSCTALKAARTATSVLPKPTSPQTRRSIGWGSLHVGLDVGDGLRSWSSVSTNGNDDSISVCHGVSGPKACPVDGQAPPVQLHQLLGHLVAAARALARVFCHSEPPIF
jgi:hypothetical protein